MDRTFSFGRNFNSRKFDANISIKYDASENSDSVIKINNSAGSQIGSLVITAISRDADVVKLAKNIELVQSLFIMVILLFLLLWIDKKIKTIGDLVELKLSRLVSDTLTLSQFIARSFTLI